VILDTSAFPLVWMRADDGRETDDDAVLIAFEALLERQRPFVLIAEGGPRAHEHSQQERKRLSLWIKHHRQELRLIKAMIVVEPSAAKRLAAKAFTAMFAKFWGYPLLWASLREEAIATAMRLLAGEPTAAFADEADAPRSAIDKSRVSDDL